jgi:protein-disulfide isomerase
MNNQKQNNSSNLPFVIIGLVLLGALVGGWWFYTNSKPQPGKPKTNNANKENAAKKADEAALNLYNNAPPGAQPANMLGSPTAAVTVEEFADYQCPTCGTQHPKMKELTGFYGNRIRYVFRSFPLTQVHKNAYDAAVAAEAAALQGKFWAMQDQLFANRQAWENSPDARKIFEEYAQKIGLDMAKFQNDMSGIITKARVDADLQRGRAAAIDGTPTIFINGRKLSPDQMDFDTMRQIIDAEMQKSSVQPTLSQPANSADNANANKNQIPNSTNTSK